VEIDCADSDIDTDCTGDDAGSDVVYVGKKESGFGVKSDSFMLFEYDRLVLRNEGLHDAPANEAGSHYIRNLPFLFFYLNSSFSQFFEPHSRKSSIFANGIIYEC